MATGIVSAAAVAGCMGIGSDPESVGLTLFNHVESPYTVELSLFRDGTDASRSETLVYSWSMNVGPEGEAHRDDLAEARPYRLEYGVYEDNSRLTDQDHVHYRPSDHGDDRITFDIHPPGVMTRR